MDTQSKPGHGNGVPDHQNPHPPGLVSAWISGVVVFILSVGIGVVVFSVLGHMPWPTAQAASDGAARFSWVFMDLLIAFMAYVAARCSFRTTLRAEAKRREQMENRIT